MSNYYIKQEQIRFQHIDQAGIVFYPRYFEMLNGIVEDFFDEVLGLPFSKMHETHGIPTVDLKVQFKRPARLGETITKKFRVQKIGGASLLCEFIFTNADELTLLTGEVTLVNVAISSDRKNVKSEELSEEIKQKITPYLIAN